MMQVEKAAISLETDVGSLFAVILGFSEYHAEEDGKQSWDWNAALFNPV